MAARAESGAPLRGCEVRAATVPTDAPESDGTYAWDRTTIVLVTVRGGGACGLGWSYADAATARLVRDLLVPRLADLDALDVEAAYSAMAGAVRNVGRAGVAAMAVSAVDAALWDLKARLLGVPLARLLGAARQEIPAYGSGGFTSYTVDVLQADATRCAGPSGFLRAAALCDAFQVPLSAYCAPQLHAHLCCAASRARHVEWFHDHARIERMLFDGAIAPERGLLRPDLTRPGVGVEVRWSEFERYEIPV